MALLEHEVEISTGRRDGDGHVRVSLFADELLALTVEGLGERAPTLLLTLDQARKLQRALAELIPLAKEAEPHQDSAGEAWQGAERRTSGELTK